ncbi:acetyltransferase (GNAT) family protein [Kineothrix alysoides]|uniref:Acetyltransferase (GNAT) family protein n=1 Tax=Kineothrix alysoides TaxID=1469948 RepID=A0A4R1QN88_9FIRM|nr:GNAT family N-acetyltransferase [Kineothrix alysoides]TCL55219.1 acetyltransferase (GNAT) family protein [Kineothrix alysoides]
MKANYPYQIDEENGMVYAWFTKMEYRGGVVISDLEPELTLFEEKYYDIYQKVGNDTFADLLHKLHSNVRQFFPLDEVRKRETYLWFENDELVGSIRIYHNEEENVYEIERVMIAPQSQGRGYGTKLLNFIVAKLQQTNRTPIVLTVAACNSKAVKMYEKFGFVPISEEMDEWKIERDICG